MGLYDDTENGRQELEDDVALFSSLFSRPSIESLSRWREDRQLRLLLINYTNKTDLKELKDRNQLAALENILNTSSELWKVFPIVKRQEIIKHER